VVRYHLAYSCTEPEFILLTPQLFEDLRVYQACRHGDGLNDAVCSALSAGNLAHLVTLNPDGSPQVTIVWVGLDGDEIVSRI
jgi:hypothetical protein